MNVNGKVFVVTGGGNGIGREVVLQLLNKAARIIYEQMASLLK